MDRDQELARSAGGEALEGKLLEIDECVHAGAPLRMTSTRQGERLVARQKGNSEGTAATLGFEARLWQNPARASAMQDEGIDA